MANPRSNQQSSSPSTSLSTSLSWYENELVEDRKFRDVYVDLIIDAFWIKCICDPKKAENVEKTKKFLSDENPFKKKDWSVTVEQAFRETKNDSEKLKNLLRTIPTDLLKRIHDWVELGVYNELEMKSDIKIESKHIREIERYMEEKKLSVTVLAGSENKLDSPNTKEDQCNVSYAMHSVGKIFTGVLMLLLVEKK